MGEKKLFIDIERVNELLNERGLNLAEAAEFLSVSKVTLKRILDGADQSFLSARFLYKLAVGFKVSADSLLVKEYRKL